MMSRLIAAPTSIRPRKRELPGYLWVFVDGLVFALSCCATVARKGSADAGCAVGCCWLSVADCGHP